MDERDGASSVWTAEVGGWEGYYQGGQGGCREGERDFGFLSRGLGEKDWDEDTCLGSACKIGLKVERVQ